MSSRRFLDTRVGTYSGIVMGPMLTLLGVYLLFVPVEVLVGTGVPTWLPGALMLLYGVWRTVRGVRGLRHPAPDADEDSGPEFSRTREAVAQSRHSAATSSDLPREERAASPHQHAHEDPAQ